MFIKNQPKEQQDSYINLLQAVGALSGLFSDSDSPYLYYRAAERIFCKAFEATDLSREDSSYDAKKSDIGIGLKTFLYKKGTCVEKVAEFNSISDQLRKLHSQPEELIYKVAEARNKRINATKATHQLSNGIYHCVARDNLKFFIYECPISPINLDKIKVDKKSLEKNTLSFTDGLNKYTFSLSKSTLFKRFEVKGNTLLELPVEILDNPFQLIQNLFQTENKLVPVIQDSVILPLYSDKLRAVPPKSGLNQWNANGRDRNEDEVYIQLPKWVLKKFPNFFPPKKEEFKLRIPNGAILSASICQGGGEIDGTPVGKSIMTNPNKTLGRWILRDVLKIKPGELCTLDMLKEIGIDSLQVTKVSNNEFTINFAPWGAYQSFLDQYK